MELVVIFVIGFVGLLLNVVTGAGATTVDYVGTEGGLVLHRHTGSDLNIDLVPLTDLPVRAVPVGEEAGNGAVLVG